jgi:hypothetical protein
MAAPKVTPAFITYTPESGGELRTIRFHAVISEGHQASSQVTKFPVQTGFVISNNTIRQNRQVDLKGIVTNTVLKSSKNDYVYSKNNSKTVFEELESIVNLGQVCHVVTNLGDYDKVIFTKFSTKQKAGMTDAMEFTLLGEEVQISSSVAGTAPKIMSFNKLAGAEKDNTIAALKKSGIYVCNDATISQTQMTLGQDYISKDLDTAGNPISTTYVATGQDATTGNWFYDVHTSATKMYEDVSLTVGSVFDDPEALREKVVAGFLPVGDCLVESAVDTARDIVIDTVNTEVGELKKSLYGALYSTMELSGNDYGQSLIHGGVGCLVRGVTGIKESRFPYQPGEALPSTDEIVTAVFGQHALLVNKDVNKTIKGVVGESTTITKVEC